MRAFLAILVALFVLALPLTAGGDGASGYVVIVHPSNGPAALDRQFVAEAFLKKVTTWPNGDVIHAVDLPPGSAARRQFSEEVLRRSIQEVKGYWQQRIFSGRDVPPPELEKEEDVVAYVLKHDGAIGYVSRSTPLGGAKAVVVQ
jgi:ABC-type phosphate transport system substrate-binding protein